MDALPQPPQPVPDPPPASVAEAVYHELRQQAASYLRRERPGHTLEPTALVHEAWIRLAPQFQKDWKEPGQFRAVAAGMMRRILVDHERRRAAAKRGGLGRRITLDENNLIGAGQPVDVIALDECLTKLAELNARQARISELRLFGGLTLEESAEVLGVGTATASREWTMARAYLSWQLAQE